MRVRSKFMAEKHQDKSLTSFGMIVPCLSWWNAVRAFLLSLCVYQLTPNTSVGIYSSSNRICAPSHCPGVTLSFGALPAGHGGVGNEELQVPGVHLAIDEEMPSFSTKGEISHQIFFWLRPFGGFEGKKKKGKKQGVSCPVQHGSNIKLWDAP